MGHAEDGDHRKITQPRWAGLIGFLLLAAAIAWVLATVIQERGSNGQTPAPVLARAGVGTPAPDFEFTILDGRPVRLGDFRGRPLVLNFFASWCDPCKEEAPVVQALAAGAAAQGYAVVGVAINDAREDVARFMAGEGLTFPAGLDLDGKVHRAYRVIGPPTTFFIDRDGVIKDKVFGPLNPEQVQLSLEKIGVGAAGAGGPRP